MLLPGSISKRILKNTFHSKSILIISSSLLPRISPNLLFGLNLCSKYIGVSKSMNLLDMKFILVRSSSMVWLERFWYTISFFTNIYWLRMSHAFLKSMVNPIFSCIFSMNMSFMDLASISFENSSFRTLSGFF